MKVHFEQDKIGKQYTNEWKTIPTTRGEICYPKTHENSFMDILSIYVLKWLKVRASTRKSEEIKPRQLETCIDHHWAVDFKLLLKADTR